MVNWQSYEKSFETLLESFDSHGKVLERLLSAWQMRRIEAVSEDSHQRMNDHVLGQHQLMGISTDTRQQVKKQADRLDSFYREVKQLLERYEQDRIDTIRRAEKEAEQRKTDDTATVLTWLNTVGESQETYHKKFVDVREASPGTAVWIMKEPKLINWMGEEIPKYSVMWLNGKKGAGKQRWMPTMRDEIRESLTGH